MQTGTGRPKVSPGEFGQCSPSEKDDENGRRVGCEDNKARHEVGSGRDVLIPDEEA